MLYDRAHGYRDRKTRDEDLVRRFLDGLYDEEARFEIDFHKEPRTIDEAVFHAVNFTQTRGGSVTDRKQKRGARRATVRIRKRATGVGVKMKIGHTGYHTTGEKTEKHRTLERRCKRTRRCQKSQKKGQTMEPSCYRY
jgi:hypothetical protein